MNKRELTLRIQGIWSKETGNRTKLIDEYESQLKDCNLHIVSGSTVCKTCNGKKKVPKRDWYDGKIIGSIKCWDCNGGVYPVSMFDNY